VAAAALLALAACDDTDLEPLPPEDGGPPPDADVILGPCDGDGGCDFAYRCNAMGLCIAPDRCLSDPECPEGTQCANSSRVCLPEGACELDGDCPEAFVCGDDGECTPGGECGETEFDISPRQPNVLVLLDRSASMAVELEPGTTRWDVAKDAVGELVSGFESEVRFGLAVFSACTGLTCSPGFIVVEPDQGTSAEIMSYLGDRGADFLCDATRAETSTGLTLYGFREEPAITDPSRANYVVLLTDGKESGPCQRVIDGQVVDGQGSARLLRAREVPAQTFVVGIDIDEPELDAIARAGGTREAVSASDRETLTDAFGNIINQATNCSFLLNEPPPDEDQLFVFFDDSNEPVPNDPDIGWTYQPAGQLLLFSGESCRQLREAEVTDVKVIYGCPDIGPD